MSKVLVIGASGFLGGRIVRELISQGHAVRCLARDPEKIRDLVAAGCEAIKGDISDTELVKQALKSMQAVYIAIHTISQQPGSRGDRFMEVEANGIHNVVAGCKANGVNRLIYVTSLGIERDSRSEWLRERWRIEESVIASGLDATIIRPGMIVGSGGRGFEMLAAQAKRRVAVFLGSKHKMRTIAVDDLIYYLVGALDQSATFGRRFDVGNDEVLSNAEVVDGVAEVLRRPHPAKLKLPPGLLGTFAPLIERMGKLPAGSIKGFVDSLDAEAYSNPEPIRSILPRPLLSFSQAARKALEETS
jgi:uncharacterized protein YbjT (DUF2867 family)